MADPINFGTSDVFVGGRLIALQFTPPTGSITNAAITGSAGNYVDASKLVHRFDLGYAQVPGTAVVAETRDLRIIRGLTGTISSVEASVTGAIATGGDRTVTVDLQKSTGAGAFATVLSGVITLNSSSTLRAVSTATISSASVVDGDILRIVIAVAGAAGSQAQGLCVSVTLQEDPL